MIHIIIWSRDRAQQLRLLLSSIKKFGNDLFFPTIIYTYSNEEFKKGYDKLIDEDLVDNTCYLKETNFRELTMEMLSDQSFDLVCLACDDNVFYRPIPSNIISAFSSSEGVGCFSLRLGQNTVLQDHYNNKYQPPLHVYTEAEGLLFWPFGRYHPSHNYGYPLALDCHIYKRNLFHDMANQIDFQNTNKLETELQRFRNYIPPLMSSPLQSCSVNIPLNNMSDITQSGKLYTVEMLNKEYLRNKVISLEGLSGQEVVGAHQELEIELVSQ